MKIHKIAIFLCLALVLSSYSDRPYKKKGINFFKGSWQQALKQAKKENKFVFVDFYTTWCGPCKKLKRTFKDPKVGDYFNKNFINVSIDAESEEGRKIAYKYGVTSYPTLIITDYKGKKRTRTTGFKKPYILINFGRRLVPL